jgi:uncharacterized membrane protein YhdT
VIVAWLVGAWMMAEHDNDPHSMTMLEQAFVLACVLLALLAVGSCIAGGG